MKRGIALLLLLSLTGCGWLSREFAKLGGYSLICVEETGVMYVQFSSGAAPLIDQNGKPKACKS
jgi:hypothetical protein